MATFHRSKTACPHFSYSIARAPYSTMFNMLRRESFPLGLLLTLCKVLTLWNLSKNFSVGAHDILSLASFAMLREHESSYFRLVITPCSLGLNVT